MSPSEFDQVHRALRFSDGWRTDPDYSLTILPCPKRVRAFLGGEPVADSASVLTLLEQDHLPVYYFPEADVRMEFLTATDHRTTCPHKGEASYWTLAHGGRTAENAVWSYPEPHAQAAPLAGHLALTWSAMDRWLEEDEEVFVHARDPMKRIDIIASDRQVDVILGEETVAHSTSALFLFETGLPTRYYLPPEDVRMDLLTPTETRSQCPYKGEAVYWSAAVDGRVWTDVVWSYPEPVEDSARIHDHLCFFNEQVDAILVDGEPVARPVTKWSR